MPRFSAASSLVSVISSSVIPAGVGWWGVCLQPLSDNLPGNGPHVIGRIRPANETGWADGLCVEAAELGGELDIARVSADRLVAALGKPLIQDQAGTEVVDTHRVASSVCR